MTKSTVDLMRQCCDKDKIDSFSNGFWTITTQELERFRASIVEDLAGAEMPEPAAQVFGYAEGQYEGWRVPKLSFSAKSLKEIPKIGTEFYTRDQYRTGVASVAARTTKTVSSAYTDEIKSLEAEIERLRAVAQLKQVVTNFGKIK